jgi:uncharacterized protein YigA (DUF484 family)
MGSCHPRVGNSLRKLGARPMKEKLERVIAALEVEAAMIGSHAQRLLEMVPSLADNEQRHEMMELAQEETERAEAIKRQIRLLQDHP